MDEVSSGFWVEESGGFVHEHEVGFHGEDAGERGQSFFAAGEFEWGFVFEVFDVEFL